MSILKVNTIQDKGGNTIISSDGSGTLTLGNDALKNTPAFYAKPSPSVTGLTSAVDTKINYTNEILDTNGYFASSRFTPLVAGEYNVFAQVGLDAGSSTYIRGYLYLYKNGAEIFRSIDDQNANYANEISINLNAIVEMNGTTDYLEVYTRCDDSSGSPQYRNTSSHFGGYKLIGA